MSKKNVFNNENRYQASTPENTLHSQKFSSDLSSPTEKRSKSDDFYQIPCENLFEFSKKDEYDFSPWPDGRFEELVASIKELGILHPIVVRKKQGEDGKFEILSGEHRWKASKILERNTVPAYVVDPCDDEKAKAIFTVTNVLTRELSIEDKIYGWSKYYESTKGKSVETIKQLQKEGILDTCDIDVSKRTIYRYQKIGSLHPFFRKLVVNKVIGIKTASEFASLSLQEQEMLLPYEESITSNKIMERIMTLWNGEYPEHTFDKAGFDYIFYEMDIIPAKPTFSEVMAEAKSIVKANIPQQDYEQANKILQEAFDLHKEFSGKTELIRKALEEYLKSHPEDVKTNPL